MPPISKKQSNILPFSEGMGYSVDMSKSLEELIEEKVLKNYRYIHGDLTKITQSNKAHHALLSAVALGDRREHSAYRRADLTRKRGRIGCFFNQSSVLYHDKPPKPIPSMRQKRYRSVSSLPHRFYAFGSPPYHLITRGSKREISLR
jgi:uncharacterized protein